MSINEAKRLGERSVFSKSDSEYGIKEIIDLLKYIPSDQDAIFGAEMIKRTLASMKISITDILDDAKSKETFGKRQIQELQAEIQDHLSRVETLKIEVADLNEELHLIAEATNNLTVNDQSLQTHYSKKDGVAPVPAQTPEPIHTPEPRLEPIIDNSTQVESIAPEPPVQVEAAPEIRAAPAEQSSILFPHAFEDTPTPVDTEETATPVEAKSDTDVPDTDIDAIFEDDDLDTKTTESKETSEIIFKNPLSS